MNREDANREVLKRLQDSEVYLVGMGKALEVVPGMKKNLIMHAGPPIEWERMCGPLRGAIIGALIYEGLAKDEEEAKNLQQVVRLNLIRTITINQSDPWQELFRHRCRYISYTIGHMITILIRM